MEDQGMLGPGGLPSQGPGRTLVSDISGASA